MECAVITTYRCNARCQMCNIWQYPTRPSEEFAPELLEKLPGGLKRLNLTGGEPMLRSDILDIVRILDTKTGRLEISTNGYFTDRIVTVCEQFPHITIRVSVEGLPKLNDDLRGIRNGFDHALRSVLRLKQKRVRDIGFAMVISDKNCSDLMDVYALCEGLGVEFATASMHNSFYFHKRDNRIKDEEKTSREMQHFIRALLTSRRPDWRLRMKDWVRAYVNLGLLRYMSGQRRLLPCGAATDLFFVSPYGEILACNGSPEPWVMGDLKTQSFDEIWSSEQAARIRDMVARCDRNCWMVGSAVPAMRKNILVPLWWIVKNKTRLALGRDIPDFSGLAGGPR
jgi:MoaA/NifB/PqqE/SkfB family radical SAM enzyme